MAETHCAKPDCYYDVAFKVVKVHIWTNEGGEVELAGYNDDYSSVCPNHKNIETEVAIAGRAWGIIMRQLTLENPDVPDIATQFRMEKYEITWKTL